MTRLLIQGVRHSRSLRIPPLPTMSSEQKTKGSASRVFLLTGSKAPRREAGVMAVYGPPRTQPARFNLGLTIIQHRGAGIRPASPRQRPESLKNINGQWGACLSEIFTGKTFLGHGCPAKCPSANPVLDTTGDSGPLINDKRSASISTKGLIAIGPQWQKTLCEFFLSSFFFFWPPLARQTRGRRRSLNFRPPPTPKSIVPQYSGPFDGWLRMVLMAIGRFSLRTRSEGALSIVMIE